MWPRRCASAASAQRLLFSCTFHFRPTISSPSYLNRSGCCGPCSSSTCSVSRHGATCIIFCNACDRSYPMRRLFRDAACNRFASEDGNSVSGVFPSESTSSRFKKGLRLKKLRDDPKNCALLLPRSEEHTSELQSRGHL